MKSDKEVLEDQIYYWVRRYALLWKQYKELSDRGNENNRLDNLLKTHSDQRASCKFEEDWKTSQAKNIKKQARQDFQSIYSLAW